MIGGVKLPFINSFAAWVLKKRLHQIELFKKYPIEVQQEWMQKLIYTARDTEWGEHYGYNDIRTYSEFKERVPIQNYESLAPLIERHRAGEENILWPTEIKWFAKSSGTTNAKSKFIPVSQEALDGCHFNTGKDMLSIYCNLFPKTKLFMGKSLVMAGSSNINPMGKNSYYGDLSAILVNNLPFWVDLFSTPDAKTALIENFEEKLERISEITPNENVTSMAGVPSWTLVLLNKILEKTGKKNILEVWPNLELFIHGGVSFSPYKDEYERLIPGEGIHYLETYNASEGFFAIQDQKHSKDMLLMLDYGIFYEFIPFEDIDSDNPRVLPLEEVELGKNYAIVISTNAGLWRYRIGDTVRFTSLYPFRIVISGRTKHYINAFGEEVIIENAEKALAVACERTHSRITDYTAGPKFMHNREAGAHEWIIEFAKAPEDIELFADILDNALKNVNSDYEAKRHNNMALAFPIIHQAPEGFFYQWLKDRNKLGGQNKVPRLSTTREYLDPLLERLKA
jgi:hypothetical protein